MADLLPPNATKLERAIDRAIDSRFAAFPQPVATLWNPATCPAVALPWLAWAVSIDSWATYWGTSRKRQAIAQAITIQRHKGTRASLQAVIAGYSTDVVVSEWWEASPKGTPGTFTITLPATGVGSGILAQMRRAIDRTKPARAHYQVIQPLAAHGRIGLLGAARTAVFMRIAGTVANPQQGSPA